MPDVTVSIGGRDFQVACQVGEEHFLRAAAAMLNAEAEPLVQQMGRLPEARMLLMSGLMLADKTAALEDENRQLKERLTTLEARPVPAPEKVEVPVIPPQVFETMAEIAARAEALADRIEERAQG
ncbi:MAG: cell division protein ZapA [Pseudotabrizicola sp.]|uniref:cell division protein ZapA n=1 Tax=Pseudotabrizicola sp. TaxID=2939647 RepID=UPI00271DAA57|nr:cell division protein ZapA [Pseudotabrizicola sp.]MDO8884876.1 cell division protein ZapA [Pseudotabrizicola sp.]MDP2083174.1 cell division protein ZapA [Pseudotabrizicola sp.]MDZ7572591.1 cell division protein ZapA [Pseudotabrizicola sp.]